VVLGSPGLVKVARRGRGLPLVRTERRSHQAGQALQPAGRRCVEYGVLVGRLRPLGGLHHHHERRAAEPWPV